MPRTRRSRLIFAWARIETVTMAFTNLRIYELSNSIALSNSAIRKFVNSSISLSQRSDVAQLVERDRLGPRRHVDGECGAFEILVRFNLRQRGGEIDHQRRLIRLQTNGLRKAAAPRRIFDPPSRAARRADLPIWRT